MAKKKNTIRIYSWNVNGIRAAAKKGFVEWFKKSRGDIVCIQETKAQPEQIPAEIEKLKNFTSYWFSAERKGYSSVGLLSKIQPLEIKNGFGNPKFDCEGRVIFAEYEKFLLVNTYFPNGGRGPERVKYKLDFYDELFFLLQKNYSGKKGIIVTGDFNTAHNEIDLARPKENENNTGFLKEEREWIDNIINLGYVDIFRKFNENPGMYTYWDMVTRARTRNVGWRIDYFMVSEDLVPKVKAADIHTKVMGSDHCPISIDLEN
ncbi:MAG: exodeoxyribonuclease III [Ignavibacteria bacterium]|nr:exodeoxyribonuclease III [Ignavibacteria bacterium]